MRLHFVKAIKDSMLFFFSKLDRLWTHHQEDQEERAFRRRRKHCSTIDLPDTEPSMCHACQCTALTHFPPIARITHAARVIRMQAARRDPLRTNVCVSRASVQLSIAEIFVSKIAAKLTVRFAVFRPRNCAETAEFRLID